MNTSKNWTTSMKPQYQQILMQSFISTVTSSPLQDIEYMAQSMSMMDKALSRMYAPHCQDPNLLYHEAVTKSSQKISKLALPKGSTLTDALIRNTLGCDQKYAKQYVQLLGKTEEESSKKQRIDEIKKKFTQSNTFIDVAANSKPFLPKKNPQNPRPVVDNQHQAYLKTQLIFLEKPNNSKVAHKNYYEKHYETITQQIDQLGGIEDTLSKMEETLKKNEIVNLKNRSLFSSIPNQKNPLPEIISSVNPSVQKVDQKAQIIDQSWLEKSRQLRQKYLSKISK